MSKRKHQFEYEKTFSYKFFSWLSGEKDPYIDNVEMVPQKAKKLSKTTIDERMAESIARREEVYNTKDNGLVKIFNKIYIVLAVIFCLFLCYFLVNSISYMEPFGARTNVVNNEVPARYIEKGMEETGSVNVVTGMILTYRAFDTFGETNVLFIATVCVMILLMIDEKLLEKQDEKSDRLFEPKNDPILQTTSKILVPVIFMFGIYIVLNGHLSPGGGFSGGSVIGAGMILFLSAFGFKKTQKFFNENYYKIAKSTALSMYGCIGFYFYLTGANGIANHIPLGKIGNILSAGIIFPINLCVGLEVACTMYAFYALFRRGGL